MTTNVIEFTLTQDEILTSNQTLHQFVKANRVKNVRARAGWEARSQGFTKMEKAHCICTVSFSTKNRRDPANWYPTAKASIDGFVDVGLLPDDDHKHLLGPDMRIGTNAVAGKIHIRFDFSEVE